MADELAHPNRGVRRGAIGVLSDCGRHLVIQRAAGVVRGGHWCFPGGHLELGETSRQAVRRELLEELGILVTPTERLGAIRLPDARYILAVWRVRRDGGPLRLSSAEVATAEWLLPSEIRALRPSLTSNLRVLDMLDASSGKPTADAPS